MKILAVVIILFLFITPVVGGIEGCSPPGDPVVIAGRVLPPCGEDVSVVPEGNIYTLMGFMGAGLLVLWRKRGR